VVGVLAAASESPWTDRLRVDIDINNNNNNLIYIAPACRMTSEALNDAISSTLVSLRPIYHLQSLKHSQHFQRHTL